MWGLTDIEQTLEANGSKSRAAAEMVCITAGSVVSGMTCIIFGLMGCMSLANIASGSLLHDGLPGPKSEPKTSGDISVIVRG